MSGLFPLGSSDGPASRRSRFRRIASLLASAIVAVMLASATSSAAPFVDVRAVWSIVPLEPLPAGVDITCIGDATGGGDAGCSETRALNASITPVPGTTIVVESFGSDGLTITNTSGGPLTETLFLFTGYSAFNPGGPQVGLGIDNPATQAARFGSSLFLESFDPTVFVMVDSFSDAKDCSIGFLGLSGTVFTPTTCGVSAPDSSFALIVADLSFLGAGNSASLTVFTGVAAFFSAQAVPEPSATWLLLASLSAMALLGMRLRQSR